MVLSGLHMTFSLSRVCFFFGGGVRREERVSRGHTRGHQWSLCGFDMKESCLSRRLLLLMDGDGDHEGGEALDGGGGAIDDG